MVDITKNGLGQHSIDALGDVVITNPQDGEVVMYDTATGKWVNNSVEAGAGYQPLDTELTALASTTSAADALPYFTGAGTATTTTLTATARTLLDDGSVAAMRTTLGLTIGTDVQAYDTTLMALASYNTNGILVQTAADTFSGRTLTGTANQITVTNGDGVSGNPTLSIPYNLELGSSAVAQSSVKFFEDSDNGSNYVLLQPSSSLASNYTVTLPSATGTLMLGVNDLSDISSPANARANLNLEIGVDVQAYDAELAALAGLTSAADKVPYFTGSGTAALGDFTAFGRSLIDDVDAAAGRSTLSAAKSGANTDIDSVTLDNTGLAIADTDASHNLIVKPGSNLSAQRTITITTGDADRTLDISAASVTVSTFGASLVDDADASTARTTLGVKIGTDVQAYDATLGSLASYNTNGLLTQTAADTFTGRTITGTANQITVSDGDGVSGNPTLSIPYNLILGSSATGPSSITFNEDTDNGSNTVTIQAPSSLAANYTLTLPPNDGDASQFLQTDGSGGLTWATGSGGLTEWTAASATGPASLYFSEDTDNGTNKITVTAPSSLDADYTVTLPAETGTVLTTVSGQPLDATLTALAGVTSAADKVPYFTGVDTASVADFTAFGRSLVDDADAAAGRTTLSAAKSGANTDIDSVTLDNTGLAVADTNASHNLIFKPGSDLTADRTFTLTTGDFNRTLDISATNVQISSLGGSIVACTTAANVRFTIGTIIGTDVQAYDATLAALASYNTNGLLTQTSADTFTGRTLTGTANQITVTNGDGVSGNPTLSIPYNLNLGSSASGASNVVFFEDTDNGTNKITVTAPTSIASDRTITLPDETGTVLTSASGQPLDATLTALAAYNTNGILVQTAADTFSGRSVTSNQLTVTNGDGVSGDITIAVPYNLDLGSSSAGASRIRFFEDIDNGGSAITLAAPSTLAADITLTLPSTDGDADQVLTTDGSGNMSWTTPTSGGVSLGSIYPTIIGQFSA